MSDRKSALRRLMSWTGPKPRMSSAMDASAVSPATKRINLALQGGGAHGAFTWGVLDALLADGRLHIDGISGTSAGAVNAVMLIDGLARGGAETARERLTAFWQAAAGSSVLPELQRDVVERLFPFLPARAWLDAMSQFWSPQQLNPLNINPLKDLIERFVDFEAIRACRHPLFIAATNVLTGDLRVFTRNDISAEAVMASACLPLLFRAVEIDGEHYWDGGYTGNPPLIPFLRNTQTEDVLLVQINPVTRQSVPTTTHEITDRISEISFNSGLLAELRAVQFVTKLIDDGTLPHGFGDGLYRRVRLHRITLDDSGQHFDADTKVKVDQKFFASLRDIGSTAMTKFLTNHFDDIGTRGTIDVVAEDIKRAAE